MKIIENLLCEIFLTRKNCDLRYVYVTPLYEQYERSCMVNVNTLYYVCMARKFQELNFRPDQINLLLLGFSGQKNGPTN